MSRPPKNPFDQFMEEAEELLAPLKLIIRIVRRPRSQPTEMSRESVSILRKVFGWDGFSFVFFTGLAFAFLQLPFQYNKARWCFIAAAIALVVKIVHSVDVKIYPKILIALLGSVLAGLGVNHINGWVSGLELEAAAREVPQIRIITVKPPISPALPPPRSYVSFDGPMRFSTQRYSPDGKLVPFDDFRVGDLLTFDEYAKVSGPNSVELEGGAHLLYVEPDTKVETQQRMIQDFIARVKKEKKEHPPRGNPKTVVPGPAGWDTIYAYTEDKQHRLITADDLTALRNGTEIIFAISEISYKDQGKLHHARTCQYLQPPAIPPGIWHFCDGFMKDD